MRFASWFLISSISKISCYFIKPDYFLNSTLCNKLPKISNNRINAIDMHKEDLDATEIKVFPYLETQDINYQN